MKISLVDVDGHHFPNLALMKLSAWHKANGDTVDWYSPLFSRPDRIYASKVFTFTRDYDEYAAGDPEPMKGGTGYDATVRLPDEIERMLPDYSIYPEYEEAYGFLSRGCIRHCPWCVVPKKEGSLHPVDDIERIAQGRSKVVLMDNNFLANAESFVLEQLSKIKRLRIAIDFNQGLDARLMTPKYAEALAGCRWIREIRFACDSSAMIEHVREAVKMIRAAGFRREIMCYALAKEIEDAEYRCRELVKMGVRPWAQPYRDFARNAQPTDDQIRFAGYVNVKGGKMLLKMGFSQYYYGRKGRA